MTRDSTSWNDFDEVYTDHCEKHDKDFMGRCPDCEEEWYEMQRKAWEEEDYEEE